MIRGWGALSTRIRDLQVSGSSSPAGGSSPSVYCLNSGSTGGMQNPPKRGEGALLYSEKVLGVYCSRVLATAADKSSAAQPESIDL
jgi:hypothetical protein